MSRFQFMSDELVNQYVDSTKLRNKCLIYTVSKRAETLIIMSKQQTKDSY